MPEDYFDLDALEEAEAARSEGPRNWERRETAILLVGGGCAQQLAQAHSVVADCSSTDQLQEVAQVQTVADDCSLTTNIGTEQGTLPVEPDHDRQVSEPKPASQPEKPSLRSWRVVHPRVVQRSQPSTKSKIVHVSSRGDVVEGILEDVGGIKWLRLQVASVSGLAKTVWMLVDGTSIGLGTLLQPVDHESAASAVSVAGDWTLDLCGVVLQSVPGRGYGLFTDQLFEAGGIVLEDKPFFTRPKPKDIQRRKEFTEKWGDAFSKIREPIHVAGEGVVGHMVASGAMVRNAIGYAKCPPDQKAFIHDLSYPDLELDHPIIAVSKQVAKLCIQHLPECRNMFWTELLRGMLAIEMNLFAGGRLFLKFSRVNHSCVPNVVYVSMADAWKFKAYRPISPGIELLHSYLGEELLLPTEIRRRHLWRSKCFECACERCSAKADPMRKIPCRLCAPASAPSGWRVTHHVGVHLRQEPDRQSKTNGIFPMGFEFNGLGEVDGDWAKVADPGTGRHGWILTHGRSLRPGKIDAPLCIQFERNSYSREEMESRKMAALAYAAPFGNLLYPSTNIDECVETTDDINNRLWLPPALMSHKFQGPFALYQDGEYRCEACGREPEHAKELIRTERWLGRLAETNFFSPEFTPSLGPVGNVGGSGGLCMVKESFLPFALDLVSAVVGVLGPQHWTVHWAHILIVDMLLAKNSYNAWTRPASIAEAIDHLLRMLDGLWDWLESLGLAQDPSCFLYDRVRSALSIYDHNQNKVNLTEESRSLALRLRGRFESCKKQVEILPLRPLIIEGTLTFG